MGVGKCSRGERKGTEWHTFYWQPTFQRRTFRLQVLPAVTLHASAMLMHALCNLSPGDSDFAPSEEFWHGCWWWWWRRGLRRNGMERCVIKCNILWDCHMPFFGPWLTLKPQHPSSSTTGTQRQSFLIPDFPTIMRREQPSRQSLLGQTETRWIERDKEDWGGGGLITQPKTIQNELCVRLGWGKNQGLNNNEGETVSFLSYVRCPQNPICRDCGAAAAGCLALPLEVDEYDEDEVDVHGNGNSWRRQCREFSRSKPIEGEATTRMNNDATFGSSGGLMWSRVQGMGMVSHRLVCMSMSQSFPALLLLLISKCYWLGVWYWKN